jgi:hypothetical protein
LSGLSVCGWLSRPQFNARTKAKSIYGDPATPDITYAIDVSPTSLASPPRRCWRDRPAASPSIIAGRYTRQSPTSRRAAGRCCFTLIPPGNRFPTRRTRSRARIRARSFAVSARMGKSRSAPLHGAAGLVGRLRLDLLATKQVGHVRRARRGRPAQAGSLRVADAPLIMRQWRIAVFGCASRHRRRDLSHMRLSDLPFRLMTVP